MENIGTWKSILEIIATSAVLVNAGLVAFTGTITQQYKSVDRVWIFVGMTLALLGAKEAIAFFVPDVPESCEIQWKRQAFIAGKVIDNQGEDEGGWNIDRTNKVEANFTVKMIDDDPL